MLMKNNFTNSRFIVNIDYKIDILVKYIIRERQIQIKCYDFIKISLCDY
jgi:hypothetical protein